MAERFQILHFYWLFSSYIMALKGLSSLSFNVSGLHCFIFSAEIFCALGNEDGHTNLLFIMGTEVNPDTVLW